MFATRLPPRRLELLGLAGVCLAAFVINAPGALEAIYRTAATRFANDLPPFPPLSASDVCLIVAPHPDDESLACAGLIQRALARGASVFVLFVTNGDAFILDAMLWLRRPVGPVDLLRLGKQRVSEAQSAAGHLGLDPANLRFLGFPDHGINGVLRHRGDIPFRSPYTGRDRVPYTVETRDAPFTRAAFVKALAGVLDEVRPTIVLLPSPLDAHPDHQATAATMRKLLAERDWLGRAWHYIIHGGAEWPLPKGLHPNLPLGRPPRGRGLPWHALELTKQEALGKRSAIRMHHTQVWAMRRFLHAFVRRNELFTPDPYPARLPFRAPWARALKAQG